LLASLFAGAPKPVPARDRYFGVALGVEAAWPSAVRPE
jgi:hypothetical protein